MGQSDITLENPNMTLKQKHPEVFITAQFMTNLGLNNMNIKHYI